MKLHIISLMLIHGVIHLLGFIREFHRAHANQLSQTASIQRPPYASRLIGILWLSAFLLFLIAAAGLITGNIWWITPAIVGIVVSQTLIVLHWHEAKWGSILNAIILVVAVISIAEWNSLRRLSLELKEIFSNKIQIEQSIQTGTNPENHSTSEYRAGMLWKIANVKCTSQAGNTREIYHQTL